MVLSIGRVRRLRQGLRGILAHALLVATALMGLAGYRPEARLSVAGLTPGMSMDEVRLLRGRPELSYQGLDGQPCWQFSDGVEVSFEQERVAWVTGFPLLEDGRPIQPEQASFQRRDAQAGFHDGVVESVPERYVETVTYVRGPTRVFARTEWGKVAYTLPTPLP